MGWRENKLNMENEIKWERDFEDFYWHEGIYVNRKDDIRVWKKYIFNLISQIRKEPKMCLRCRKEIKSTQNYLKKRLGFNSSSTPKGE